MELIYIMTYNCNFKCKYCDIEKREQNISNKVLEQSYKFINNSNLEFSKVKFFGGEPLLEKEKIKSIVNNTDIENLYITTNSSLIDDDFFIFIKENNIKLTFSIDGDAETTNKNRLYFKKSNKKNQIILNTKKYYKDIRVNQVITSDNSKNFFKNFKYIYDLGVRNFNFLPEYYKEWTKEGLKNLEKGFKEIINFKKEGNDFYLVNLENYSKISFFNLGIIIDVDGSIYGTNLIMLSSFEKYKDKLKIGNVEKGLEFDILNDEFITRYIKKINYIIQKEYSNIIIKSVKYVDLILNNFVNKYKLSIKK